MAAKRTHVHLLVCKKCGERYLESCDRPACDLPKTVKISHCPACSGVRFADEPPALRQCPYCGEYVLDDETGNYHMITCQGKGVWKKSI
jgi:ribosomal protein L32